MLRALAANVLVPLALAAGLFLVLEGGCRAALRLKTGEWPETQVSAYTRFVEKIGKAYRPHPVLIVAGRPNAALEAAGHVVHFNARGQRVTNVRDVPVPKPAGTYRVLCEGGSTTFDLLAADDAGTWPARLGTLLRPGADVVAVPIRLVSRLVFVEWLRGRLKPRAEPATAEGYAPSYAWNGGPKRD